MISSEDEMRKRLDDLVQVADQLGHDFDSERDQQELNNLLMLLGNVYPIGVLKEASKHYQKYLDSIEYNAIPDLLMEEGMAKITTQDGLSVELKTEYSTKILDETGFFSWMDEEGGSSLYKETFKFSAGENLEYVRQAMKEAGVSYEEKKDIHHMTLKKFVKERMDDGLDIPADLASVGQFTHAIIKKVK